MLSFDVIFYSYGEAPKSHWEKEAPSPFAPRESVPRRGRGSNELPSERA